MICPTCRFEQSEGRFCGRCGAVVAAAGQTATTAASGQTATTATTGQTAATAATSPLHRVPLRRWAPVILLAVGLVSVLVWFAGQPEVAAPTATTADDPVTLPEAGGADPPTDRSSGPAASDEPATPAPGEPDADAVPAPDDLDEDEPPGSAGEPGPTGAVDPPPEGFRDETGTVLLFDDGYAGALAVDLDTWQRQEIALPGQRPGDQPFRLWPLGDRVVVGWEEIWTLEPGRPESARQLGQATIFVPHADPQAVWLIDYEGGSLATGTSTWTLVDATGTELVTVRSVPGGLTPVRGVPDGLVVATPNGTLVYDLDEERFIDTPIGESARVASVAGDRVVWCDTGRCERLVITDPVGQQVATIGSGERFAPSLVWVSPDGERLAAWVRVEVGAGVDIRLRIYRTGDGERLADTQVSLGALFGDWTEDGQQFFAWTRPQTAGAPAELFRWSGGGDIEVLPVDDHGIREVAGFLALPADRFDEVLPDGP